MTLDLEYFAPMRHSKPAKMESSFYSNQNAKVVWCIFKSNSHLKRFSALKFVSRVTDIKVGQNILLLLERSEFKFQRAL